MLPLLTLNQYLTTFVSRDLQRSVDGRILKVRVLTDLRLFNEAFITLQRLLHGERLPQIGDSHFRQTESKMSSLKFNTSKPITEPVNLRVSPSYLTCFLSLCLSLSISVSFDSGYSVYPFVLSLGLSVCLYVCVCFHLSFISLCLAIFYHYGCVSVRLSICLLSLVSICLSFSLLSMVVCLSTSFFFTLSICLSVPFISMSVCLQVLEMVLDKRLSSSLATLYGPHMTCHLSLVQAHLFVSLADTIPVIPKMEDVM